MSKLTEKLKNVVDEMRKDNSGSKKDYQDERFWKPKFNKSGLIKVKLRFLPNKILDYPFSLKLLTHMITFKTNFGNRYLFYYCKKNIGEKCILCDYGFNLWKKYTKEGGEKLKNFAVSHFVRRRYISNVLIISDDAEPENNGKIFLYEYPEIVYNLLISKIAPSEEDIDMGIEPQIVIDPEEGNDFYLYVYKNKMGYNQYDKCKFLKSSKIKNWEKILGWNEENEIFENLYDLKEYKEEIIEKINNISNSELVEKYESLLSLTDFEDELSQINNEKVNNERDDNKNIKNEKINDDINENINDINEANIEINEDDDLDSFFDDLD